MREIEQIVDTYLKDDLADYAIMIDGVWGCGKTHFWKTVMTERIVDHDAKEAGKKLRPAYVSLYGLANLEDIDRSVWVALHPKFGAKGSKLAGGLVRVAASLANLDLDKADVKVWDWLSLGDVVLCFDDLERSSIPIVDVMGYINQYVEHKKAKTFVLCNQAEVRGQDIYTRAKEKLIGRTIKFQPDHAAVVDSLIKSITSDPLFQQFLTDRKAAIVQLFQKSNLDNIRILKHGLSTLHTVHSVLTSRFPGKPDLAERYIPMILSLTFEMDSGQATPEEIRDIALQERTMFYTVAFSKDENESYVMKYFKKYYDGGYEGAATSTSICNFILGGHLDAYKLVDELKWLTNTKSEFDNAIELFFNRNVFDADSEPEDAEFQKATKAVLSAAKEGSISTYPLLMKIFGYAMAWAAKGLILETKNEVEKLMKDAVQMAVAKGQLKYDDDLEGSLHFFEYESNSDLTAFRDFLLKVNDSLEKQKTDAEALTFLDDLQHRPDAGISKLYHEWKSVPVLSGIDPAKMAEVIKQLPNGEKTSFYYALENRYQFFSPRVHSPEMPTLTSLLPLLDAWVKANSQRPRGLSVMLVERIVDGLRRIVCKHEKQV